MKKKLALLLACSMALSLTACGGGSKPAETTAAPETTTRAGIWMPSSRRPRPKAN